MRRVPIDRLKPTGAPFVVAAAVVAVDGATKIWARHTLADAPRHVVGPVWLRVSTNRGFSFSLGSNWPAVAGTLTLVALGVVTVLALFAQRGAPSIGFGLLIGGGIGNVVDRFSSTPHAVTDFIAVGSFPDFNVADAAITCGLAILFVLALRQRPLVRLR